MLPRSRAVNLGGLELWWNLGEQGMHTGICRWTVIFSKGHVLHMRWVGGIANPAQ